MEPLTHLFENNRAWSERTRRADPDFFLKLSRQQRPDYLWIGCSDSRVPANEIVGLLPGELFVHRNVANVVVHTDLNCLSVLQFAVDVLKVRHVIVCGHYGCSGVGAALGRERLGLVDNWLRHVQDVRDKHAAVLQALPGLQQRADTLCELNVIEQVGNVCATSIVRDAWERGQPLAVHGWTYGLRDGLVRDLQTTVTTPGEIPLRYGEALARALAGEATTAASAGAAAPGPEDRARNAS
jgi:carbonic anhydrase